MAPQAGQQLTSRSDTRLAYQGAGDMIMAGANRPAIDPNDPYAGMLKKMLVDGEFSTSDPSYKWRFEQGQQAVERSLGARGLLDSGNAAIELQKYGQGAASTEYQAQFERLLGAMTQYEAGYNKNMDRLAQLAGITLSESESYSEAPIHTYMQDPSGRMRDIVTQGGKEITWDYMGSGGSTYTPDPDSYYNYHP